MEATEFLLAGLLQCPYETVREGFRQSLAALCRKTQPAGPAGGLTALAFTLKLLSTNFALISKHPCQQYLELFSELLDEFYLKPKQEPAASTQQVIDPEALLSAVIDQISEENQRALRARAEGQAGAGGAAPKESTSLFLGLITLAGKVLDSFASESSQIKSTEAVSKSQKQQQGLVDEIFTGFLFPAVFSQD